MHQGFLNKINKSYLVILVLLISPNLFNKLNNSGKIIIFVPASKILFSEFDKQIGHFRRYDFKSLKRILPTKSKIIEMKYIDSIGFFASLVNKLFLKSNNPTLKQVLFWDVNIYKLL